MKTKEKLELGYVTRVKKKHQKFGKKGKAG